MKPTCPELLQQACDTCGACSLSVSIPPQHTAAQDKLKIEHFLWTSSHGIYERGRRHIRHSLKHEFPLPAFVSHNASAHTSHQLYFASSIIQSTAKLERYVLCLSYITCCRYFARLVTNTHRFVIEEIMEVKCCQISYSQSVSVDDKPNSDRQLVAVTHPREF